MTTSSRSPPRSPTARAGPSSSSAPSTASTVSCKQLAQVGIKAGGLHGGKRQNQRTRILAEFKEGTINVLVCTDVAARGIHVDDVSLVLHVDPPQDHKDYLHRGGRTARAGEKGTVMTLVLPNERRSTDAMTRRAGIKPSRIKATPGHPRLEEAAGARRPTGEPIPVWEPSAPATKQRQRRGVSAAAVAAAAVARAGSVTVPLTVVARATSPVSVPPAMTTVAGATGGYRSDRPASAYRPDRAAATASDRPRRPVTVSRSAPTGRARAAAATAPTVRRATAPPVRRLPFGSSGG